jgi:hypothetical protein
MLRCLANDFEIPDNGVLGLAVDHEGRFPFGRVRLNARNRAGNRIDRTPMRPLIFALTAAA